MEKVLVIAGPTGVGKTSLSVELAKACKDVYKRQIRNLFIAILK